MRNSACHIARESRWKREIVQGPGFRASLCFLFLLFLFYFIPISRVLVPSFDLSSMSQVL
ncbi:hypothetical protein BDV41DRAFT_552624, partial [Aspergillus transmontanensis]